MARLACLIACLALLATAAILPGMAAAQKRSDGEGTWEDIESIKRWLPDATEGDAVILDITTPTRRPRQLFSPDDPDDIERQVFVLDDADLGITVELRIYSIDLGLGNTVDILCNVGLPR